MRADWFLPKKLAVRLAAGQVSDREVAYLMLAGLLFGSVIFYGAFTWANPPWSFLSFLEFIVVVVVTVVGFTNCYYAAGGDKATTFVKHFTCLSFGTWLWATVITWLVYWGGVWLYQAGLFAAFRYERMGLAQNLASIGASFEWLWTFSAAVAWQLLYFAWMRRNLYRAASAV
jgi:hypothetical protein